MPMYDYQCHWCLKVVMEFKKIVARHEAPRCPLCRIPMELKVSAPYVRGEITPYESPATGKMIESRAQRREDLKASGCVEWDRGMKEEVISNRARAETKLEAEVEHTIESEIVALPARKREALEGEMRGGLDAQIERGTL